MQRWELVNIFVYHKHDVYDPYNVVACSYCRKRNYTLIPLFTV